jgi:hypothetical protein
LCEEAAGLEVAISISLGSGLDWSVGNPVTKKQKNAPSVAAEMNEKENSPFNRRDQIEPNEQG